MELLFTLTVFFTMAYIIFLAHCKIKDLGGVGAPFVGDFIDQIMALKPVDRENQAKTAFPRSDLMANTAIQPAETVAGTTVRPTVAATALPIAETTTVKKGPTRGTTAAKTTSHAHCLLSHEDDKEVKALCKGLHSNDSKEASQENSKEGSNENSKEKSNEKIKQPTSIVGVPGSEATEPPPKRKSRHESMKIRTGERRHHKAHRKAPKNEVIAS